MSLDAVYPSDEIADLGRPITTKVPTPGEPGWLTEVRDAETGELIPVYSLHIAAAADREVNAVTAMFEAPADQDGNPLGMGDPVMTANAIGGPGILSGRWRADVASLTLVSRKKVTV